MPLGDGTLKTTIDELALVELAIVDAVAARGATLNAYRWWRPDMSLPALWNWISPDTDTARPDNCNVEDTLRIAVTIGVDPQAVAGEGDLLELEEYGDLALPIIDGAVYGSRPLGQRMARRRGFRTVSDVLGDTVFLALEFPLEVELRRSTRPQTP